jgi:NAD(P)-dependent dehydrogenase (short-subunit alcohol dehydrogenase family)
VTSSRLSREPQAERPKPCALSPKPGYGAIICERDGVDIVMSDRFSLSGRIAVVTGGYGVIGGTIASSLAEAGVKVAIVGRRREAAQEKVDEIGSAGGTALSVPANVVDEAEVRAACDEVLGAWGQVDILINAAGGSVLAARNDNRSIFEVSMGAFDEVLRLNLHGTVVPSMVFGRAMAEGGSGCIVNISSMAATLPLTGVMGYSIAKAGIENMTRWLAMDLARRYGAGLRVNAIAPGFFLGNQNRAVLVNPDGSHTSRGATVIGRTPMGRFGRADELVGPVLFLCSDAASFVTGAVVPVDGGFSAFSGV